TWRIIGAPVVFLRSTGAWLTNTLSARRAGLDGCSAAGDTHMARNCRTLMAPVDDEIMTLGLTGDGFADSCDQAFITFGLTQGCPQIGGVILTKAHEQSTGTGQSYAIAALAEVMRERRDEAETLAGFLDADITRRTAAAFGGFRQCPTL